MRYHVNPESGNPGLCLASKKCPFGGSSEHYNSKKDARAAYELKQELRNVPVSRPKNMNDPRWDKLFPELTEHRGKKRSLAQELKDNKRRSISCPECGRKIGDASIALAYQEPGATYNCKKCDTVITNIEQGEGSYPLVNPNPDSPTYGAVEPANVTKMLWYHWSNRKDWALDITDPEYGPERVHLGGEVAASDRSVYYGGANSYLYVVEVLPDSTVDPELMQEEANDFTVENTNETDVVRYMNLFEDSGSVSLAVKPSKIKVLGFRNLMADEANSVSTYSFDEDVSEWAMKSYPDGKA